MQNLKFKPVAFKPDTGRELTNLSDSDFSVKLCRGCGSKSIELFEDYLLICTDCGLENEKTISATAEWRTADKSRCFIVKYSNSVLSTGAKGNSKFNKFSNSMNYADRKDLEATNQFNELSEKWNIPNVIINTALKYFTEVSQAEKARNKKLIKRGGNLQGIKASCVYLSYLTNKDQGVFKTQKEIAEIFEIPISFLHSNLPIVQKIVKVEVTELSGFEDFINSCYDRYNTRFSPNIPPIVKSKVQKFISKHQKKSKLQTFMKKSVIAGVFYHFLKSSPKEYRIIDMTKAWSISKITIQKVESVVDLIQNSTT